MKRTDLIALAEKLHQVSTEENLSFDELDDIKQAADFLRQIAQAQPVRGAMFGMYGVGRITLVADGSEREWVDKCGGSLLYHLPLED